MVADAGASWAAPEVAFLFSKRSAPCKGCVLVWRPAQCHAPEIFLFFYKMCVTACAYVRAYCNVYLRELVVTIEVAIVGTAPERLSFKTSLRTSRDARHVSVAWIRNPGRGILRDVAGRAGDAHYRSAFF